MASRLKGNFRRNYSLIFAKFNIYYKKKKLLRLTWNGSQMLTLKFIFVSTLSTWSINPWKNAWENRQRKNKAIPHFLIKAHLNKIWKLNEKEKKSYASIAKRNVKRISKLPWLSKGNPKITFLIQLLLWFFKVISIKVVHKVPNIHSTSYKHYSQML